ncbi:MAG: phospholipase C, phosphocholine-specific [Acidobacteria bacterium]|nr:MAG: phospholipase C, phosphocholine-specific [Acidobacteriota bacterium]
MQRREFLRVLGAGAAAAAFPASILKALAIPAHRRTGTIEDVEHIVFFMQENRSFDHYFGMLRGVRGFGDPRAIRLEDGASVWAQPRAGGGAVLPFHPGAPNPGLRFLEDLAHDWTSTHAALREGWYDGWVQHKTPTTMAHLVRGDIPFHYALADAFTICDAYHCSLLGPTGPNRMHMWTGWVGNDGRGGGPRVDNDGDGFTWMTYPERLEQAGISWKIYQDTGTGLSTKTDWGDERDAYIGNYGDNALLYFKAYEDSTPGSALYTKARTGTRTERRGTLFEEFARDVRGSRLPQVSWIVAPEAYCEHPNWPANYGAWYTAQVLDALTANPEVWSKTILFLTYDENDGFFDHVVPPTPPMTAELGQSTVSIENEIYPGSQKYPSGPYGLGVRVPMMVISPWSKGGWVSSEVFDHTSMLRFAERRFGVRAENITPWRRAVCGDLTATLDFATPNEADVALPSTVAYAPPDRTRHASYKPALPKEQQMPQQELGQRPARAVPYGLEIHAQVMAPGVELRLHNAGRAAATVQVRARAAKPRCFTIGVGAELRDTWKAARNYALAAHGPNGFYRELTGTVTEQLGEPELRYDDAQNAVELHWRPSQVVQITVRDGYTRRVHSYTLAAGESWRQRWALEAGHGWYDLDVRCAAEPGFRRHFAGHLERGANSLSDPHIGQSA